MDFSYLLHPASIDLPDPVQQAHAAISLAQAASANKLQQYQLAQQQRQDAAANGFNRALGSINFDDQNSVQSALMNAPDEAKPLIVKAYQDYQKNKADTDYKKAETVDKTTSAKSRMLTMAGGLAADAAKTGTDPTQVQQTAQRMGLDPSMFVVPDGVDPRQHYASLANGAIDAAKQADLADKGAQRAETGRHNTATEATAAANAAEMARYHSGRIGVEQARLSAETGNGTGPISADAITNAATRYNIDGTLPPMGMGKAAAAGRSAILNKAAELAATGGISPEDQRYTQLSNKADAGALAKVSQQANMVGSFEKNFNMNANLALDLSKKVGNSGVPLVNQWINAGKRSVAGDPQLAAYDTAINTALMEYSKIVSGAMGNTPVAEGQIKEAQQRLNAAQTPEQVEAVLSFMKKETDNRMTSFRQQQDEIKGRITGKSAPAASTGAPRLGEVRKGYLYKGGDPSSPSSWEKAS